MVAERLDELVRRGLDIPAYYVEPEECKVIVNDAINCRDEERYYIDLTHTPLDIHDDKAITLVTNQYHNEILPAKHRYIGYLDDLEFSKPSKTHPQYYREGTRLYLMGLTSSLRPNIRVVVYYAKAIANANLAATDEYFIEPSLDALLLDEVETLARRELDIPSNHEDMFNDGTQE